MLDTISRISSKFYTLCCQILNVRSGTIPSWACLEDSTSSPAETWLTVYRPHEVCHPKASIRCHATSFFVSGQQMFFSWLLVRSLTFKGIGSVIVSRPSIQFSSAARCVHEVFSTGMLASLLIPLLSSTKHCQ